MPEALLTKRAVVAAKIESEIGVDASPSSQTDALLVEAPDFTTDLTMLERNFSRFDLDAATHRVGRKLAGMKFTHEWRSNGRSHSGLAADAPKLARLLRTCGFAQTAISTAGAAQVGAVNAAEANVSSPTWVGGGSWADLTMPIRYIIAVTTGGASGVAEVSITPDAQAILSGVAAIQTGVTITTATALQLKTGGGKSTLTPTWTGDLTIGDAWELWVYPLGLLFTPVSTNFEALTCDMWLDGLKHKLTAGMGSFSMSAEAGGYAKTEFTYLGQWNDPTDSVLPTNARYERQLPAIVELSQLQVDSFSQVVSKFGVEVKNEIVPRQDANADEGYNGVRIVSRAVEGNTDPEATLVANYDFWGKLSAGAEMLVRNRVGQTAGNRIFTMAPCVQYANLAYGERDQIRTMDAQLKFARKFGNDSVSFLIS